MKKKDEVNSHANICVRFDSNIPLLVKCMFYLNYKQCVEMGKRFDV